MRKTPYEPRAEHCSSPVYFAEEVLGVNLWSKQEEVLDALKDHRRVAVALRVVTPADVLEGRLEAILAQRKEVQRETFDRRRRYNQEVRETLKPGASSPQSLGPRTVQNR